MSETTPDPADVHTGTDRVADVEAQIQADFEAHPGSWRGDPEGWFREGWLMQEARVQALTAERDEALTVIQGYQLGLDRDQLRRERDAARAELAELKGNQRRCEEGHGPLLRENKTLSAELAAANASTIEAQKDATYNLNRWRAALAERDALQATLDRVTALADEWDQNGINCECGHSIGGEHNGLGCYARLSYDPLVTCECKLTDDQFESDVAVRDLRAALTPEGTDRADRVGAEDGGR